MRRRKWDYPASRSSSKESPSKVITNPASILTRGVEGAADLPKTPLGLHQRKHSQASGTSGSKALLSGGKILLAALKTRSHSVNHNRARELMEGVYIKVVVITTLVALINPPTNRALMSVVPTHGGQSAVSEPPEFVGW
jgi:hypothetical protein